VVLQCAAEVEDGRAGKIRVGILGGLSQATGGVASNHVKQTKGYGNTDAQREQRPILLQQIQFDSYRFV
jgi:hypothetical protein